jgi:cytochrome P450
MIGGRKRGQLEPLSLFLQYFTFDLIGELAFGEPFGCLESSSYHPWISMIFDNVKSGVLLGSAKQYPLLEWLIQRLIPKHLIARRKAHRQHTEIKARRRMETKTDRIDFLARMAEPDSGVTEREFIATSSTLIVAGSETTATLLSAATFFLLTHPEKLAKLTGEIRSSFTDEKDINFVTVNGLRYMSACIDESLRMHPPVPGLLPRTVPIGGDTINGRMVPEKVCQMKRQNVWIYSWQHADLVLGLDRCWRVSLGHVQVSEEFPLTQRVHSGKMVRRSKI